MATNRVGKGWFPEFQNDHDYENSTFVYHSNLEQNNPEIYFKARGLMDYSLKLIDADITPSLFRLRELAEREKKKEDDFLNKKCRVGRVDSRTDGERIKDFNSLYQRLEIFNRNIRKIEAIDEKVNSAKIDITSVFRGYLTSEINKIQIQDINEETLKEATKHAIVRALSSEDFQNEGDHSYLQLLEELQQMADYSKFIDDVFDIYLGNAWKQYEKEIKQGIEHTEKIKINGNRGLSGNLMEVLSQRVMQTLGVDAKLTGASGQKADLVVAEFEIKIPEALVYGFQSIRADFIKQWKDMYSNLKDGGDIVEISAKNYSLGNNFQGFTAQDKVTIDNFAATLEQFGFKDEKIDPLVYALLNIGPDTLEKESEAVIYNLATLIAYFLFDDIDMDLNTSAKAIHLFNLDGIYVPLSSFLFAAYNSLQDFKRFSNKYVHVSYKPKEVVPEDNDNLMEQTWLNTKIAKLDQPSIKIHFFKDFTAYIKSLGLLNI